MKLVIFGLSISSSWGNGHATIWRGLCRALIRRKHEIVFFERDVPYYAAHRDLVRMPGLDLRLYSDWNEILRSARQVLADADVGMVTSYCPDGISASDLVLSSSASLKVFYDLDAPVTMERLAKGERLDYVGPRGYADFDLVLSYSGGKTLPELRSRLGARNVAALYGCVDPSIHRPVIFQNKSADLSYLGTYAEDRQPLLDSLFIQPARKLPTHRFVLGGSLYPSVFPWTDNIYYLSHVPPPDHPSFYCASKLTLNITRRSMARMGYCPSGRLFEAAACGIPVLSDSWEGLEDFFEPGSEIIIARNTDEAVQAITLGKDPLIQIARAARERALDCHTADRRALELEDMLNKSFASGQMNNKMQKNVLNICFRRATPCGA